MLVVAPTRELAMQSAEVAASMPGVRSLCVYGGVPKWQQKKRLREGLDLLVATPGRLLDLASEKIVGPEGNLLGDVNYVVLDEADRMLDMGFEPQIKQIFAALPAQRQTLFFTATWPKSVRKLAASFLRHGDEAVKRVFIGTSADAELEANAAVSQTFIQARDDEKDLKMYNLLQQVRVRHLDSLRLFT